MATADPPRIARPDGFSLIEVMVAMVITGILSVVVFQFVIGQDRFAQTQSAREEVQQNARVAAEIIGSELRAAAPDGLDEIEDDRILFESARLIGIVCAQPSSSEMFVTTSTEADAGAFDERFGLKARDVDGTWHYGSDNKNHRIVVENGDISDCEDTGPDPNDPLFADAALDHGQMRVLRLSRSGGSQLPAGDFVVGEALVVLYDRLSYFVDEVDGTRWVTRHRLGTPRQRLAGPVTADGLRFEYLDMDGQPTADETQVREIGVSVTAQSQRRPSEIERKNISIFLRQ